MASTSSHDEHFQIDNLKFPFAPETELGLADVDDALYLSVWAQVDDRLKALEGLWSGYESDEKVGFRVRCRGVHQAGVPTGHFTFEDGRSDNHDVYLWDDGWDYPLEFSGTLTLKAGTMALVGRLSPSYRETPSFAVSILKRLPENLDWSMYRFSSLEETRGADPLAIRFLEIVGPSGQELPEDVYGFKNLRVLDIRKDHRDRDQNAKIPLANLSERIGELDQLERLTFFGTSLRALPPALGKLQKLKTLQISNSLLQSTPEEIWRLPLLTHLSLEGNRLSSVPDSLDLPDLDDLDLGGNLFETLPERLARLPKLRRLGLEGNPLKSLPGAYNEVPNIVLPFEDKQRLLDYDYKGADGGGVVDWDDSVYQAQSDPGLWNHLSRRAKATPALEPALRSVAKWSLRLEHDQPGDDSQAGNTRFGGWPDLPHDIGYPTFELESDGARRSYACEFLAQIDCSAVSPLQGYLPRSGWLYFFIDSVENLTARVLYFKGDRSELRSNVGSELDSEAFFDFCEPPYQSFRAGVSSFVGLPYNYSASSNRYLFSGDAAVLAESEDDPLDPLRDERERAHEVNGYVFTQHESPEMQAALKLRGRPQDWIVLLKVASIGDFQWWDAGDLFFVIHKSDLAQENFSAVYCGLESS